VLSIDGFLLVDVVCRLAITDMVKRLKVTATNPGALYFPPGT
jgi:hypothetical protein